jgi:hypothetical protein
MLDARLTLSGEDKALSRAHFPQDRWQHRSGRHRRKTRMGRHFQADKTVDN